MWTWTNLIKNTIKKIAHSGLKRHKFSLCTWHRESWGGGGLWQLCCCRTKKNLCLMWDQFRTGFLWPRFPGRVEMHRWTDVHCWLSAGAFGTFRPHTHTCRGVWVLALVHWPGAGLYPPAPQSPLSPAAVPVGSNPSAFSVSLIPFPNHFYNSPFPWNLPSLFVFFPTKSFLSF